MKSWALLLLVWCVACEEACNGASEMFDTLEAAKAEAVACGCDPAGAHSMGDHFMTGHGCTGPAQEDEEHNDEHSGNDAQEDEEHNDEHSGHDDMHGESDQGKNKDGKGKDGKGKGKGKGKDGAHRLDEAEIAKLTAAAQQALEVCNAACEGEEDAGKCDESCVSDCKDVCQAEAATELTALEALAHNGKHGYNAIIPWWPTFVIGVVGTFLCCLCTCICSKRAANQQNKAQEQQEVELIAKV